MSTLVNNNVKHTYKEILSLLSIIVHIRNKLRVVVSSSEVVVRMDLIWKQCS